MIGRQMNGIKGFHVFLHLDIEELVHIDLEELSCNHLKKMTVANKEDLKETRRVDKT